MGDAWGDVVYEASGDALPGHGNDNEEDEERRRRDGRGGPRLVAATVKERGESGARSSEPARLPLLWAS